MHLRPFLILLLAFAIWACQPSAPEGEGRDLLNERSRQGILKINEQPEGQSEYVVQWGKVKIPLLKYANPEVYSGMVEVGLWDFQRIVREELRLLKKGKALDAELISIHREPYSRFDPFLHTYPAFENGRLEEAVAATFLQGIRQGDVVALRLSSPTDSIMVQSAMIKIADPFEPYEPSVQVPRPRYDGDVYGFQVIQEAGRRPLLRIDTTSEATRHIFDLYRNNRLYRVIHISGFQTRHRLLADRDQLFRATEIRSSEVLGCGHDWLSLPEYTDFRGANVRLEWGEMLASPSSENHHLVDFQRNFTEPLRLMVGQRELPIRGFQLFTHGRERHPELYVVDSLFTPTLLKALCLQPPASTVYFDKIVVEDEPGRLRLFPQAFAFNIGAERPYSMEIEEHLEDGTPPVLQWSSQPGATMIQFKAMSLPEVLPWLLGLDSSQVRFQAWSQGPRLDIRFASAYYPLEDGKSLILRELQNRYGITIDWGQYQQAYRLERVDSARLGAYLEYSEAEPIYYLDAGNKTALLVHTPSHQLAQFLARELEVAVVDHTGLPEGTRLRIELDFSSLAAARESLEHHGLSLSREKQGAQVTFSRR